MPYLIAPPDSGDSVNVAGVPHEVFRGRVFTDDGDVLRALLSHGFAVDESDDQDEQPATAVDPDAMTAMELRGFLKERGETPGARTSEDTLRARVREILAAEAAA